MTEQLTPDPVVDANALCTQARYARHRGCSREAVRRQVEAKKIEAIGPDKLICPRLADLQWAERVRPRADAAGPLPGPAAIAALPAQGQLDAAAPQPPDASPVGDSYQESTRRKALAEARMAEINAKRAAGEVYDKGSADQAVADAFRKLSERIFAVPRRAAGVTAGMIEPREIETLFEDELRKAFGEWELSIRPQLEARLAA